ncbi:unnamed protein product [Rhizoctonia solani]|nr:unnamed protein product [Rhizoctonia solani]
METTNADQARNPEPDVRPTVTEEDSDSDAGTAPNEEIHPTGVDVETKHNRNPSRSYSAKHTGSTSQRQLERVGATNIHLVHVGEKRLVEQEVEAFNRFDKELNNVNAALRLLGSTMQLFGSSVGVLHAIYQLRKSLLRLQFHVRENATTLYDNSIKPNEKRYVREVKPEMKANGRIKDHKPKETLEVLKQKTEGKRYKNINGSMEEVAINLEMFVIRINEISGFYDELVNQTFTDFAKELQYRVGVFNRREYHLNMAFRERINKLAVKFTQHLDSMRQALKSFQKNSIPIIQRSQERRGLGLQGLSAVATFFSGITATTIQYQLEGTSTPLQSTVNGLWITSLACSIASAVSAQVVYFWRMSRFSSPSKHTPGFIARVLQYTPLIYLCLSVSMLMVGLSVYTFSSNQDIIISILISVFTGLLSFEFMIFGVWVLLEYVAFTWTDGEKWFLQVHTNHLLTEMWKYMADRMRASWIKLHTSTVPDHSIQEPGDATEKGAQPGHQLTIDFPALIQARHQNTLEPRGEQMLQNIQEYKRLKKVNDFINQYPPVSHQRNSTLTTNAEKYAYLDAMKLLTAISRHNGLIKHLAFSPDQTLLATCGWDGTVVISNADEIEPPIFTLKHTEEEAPTEPQPLQKPLFGKDSAGEFCVSESAWSPDGAMLATRTRTRVWVWNMKSGTFMNSIEVGKGRSIERIAWSWKVENIKPVNNAPEQTQSQATLKPQTKILERSQILVVIEHAYEHAGTHDYSKLQGTQSTQDIRALSREISIKDLVITSMATVNDCSIPHVNNFGVPDAKNAGAPATNNTDARAHRSKSMVNDYLLIGVGVDTKNNPNIEVEKFLFLYNFISGEFSRLSPLSGKVHSVSVTVPNKNIAHVLVTYKGQGAYPQLWEIKVIPDRKKCEFARIRTYFSKATSNLSGRGCFGGPGDIYVCCSSQDGEIFIWDRETGILIFTITPKDEEHLKFFTCNKLASSDFLCASGAVNGVLSVWSTKKVEPAPSAYILPLDSDQQYQPISSPEPLSLFPEGESIYMV